MEPVEIDRLPVKLTPAQERQWKAGHQRKVRKAIRAKRLAKQKPVEEMEPAPSFKDVMGDDL